MSRQDGLSPWIATVSTQMPQLSRPQARVLAVWSYGMVLAQSCGLTTVATVLALLLHTSPLALRQQLREWCYAAADKKGCQRREVEVQTCFAALLGWVLAWWPAEERRLALALDATTLGQRFTVLAVSVVYRGCAIPVAWVVVPARQKGTWRPHWEGLSTPLHAGLPDDWTVLGPRVGRPWPVRALAVPAPRRAGLAALPFLRINQGGQGGLFRPYGERGFRPLAAPVRQPPASGPRPPHPGAPSSGAPPRHPPAPPSPRRLCRRLRKRRVEHRAGHHPGQGGREVTGPQPQPHIQGRHTLAAAAGRTPLSQALQGTV